MFSPRQLSAATLGLVTALAGCVIMLGWKFDIPWLIQIDTGWVPVQFNTALSLTLIGLAATLRSLRPRAAWPFALAAALLLGLTGVQFLLGVDLGIDQLFHTAQVWTLTWPPGRMAPNACAALYLLAVSALLTERQRDIALILIAVALAVGVAALVGYAANVPTAYAWGDMTHMALRTALGICGLSVALGAEMWSLRSIWAALPVTLSVVVTTISIVLALISEEQATPLIMMVVLTGALITGVVATITLRAQAEVLEADTRAARILENAREKERTALAQLDRPFSDHAVGGDGY